MDQVGESTFQELLNASWRAGVVSYQVDLEARTVAYQGCNGEEYIEAYPAVTAWMCTGVPGERNKISKSSLEAACFKLSLL